MVMEMFNIGDYVTRKSYGNDLVFEVIEKNDNVCVLHGVDYRLIADAKEEDLQLCDKRESDDEEFITKLDDISLSNRDEFFYIPGRILHLDGDASYLKRCMEFYEKANIMAYGKSLKESEMPNKVLKYLKETNPDILVITGHDAYYKKRIGDSDLYKNSKNFIKTVIEAKKYEKSNKRLIIIAGACQSNYESLIKAGSDYASSPKRINIHALDPAIIASTISLSERNSEIDLKKLLDKTKYGKDGMGGLKTMGMMNVGYPRNEI